MKTIFYLSKKKINKKGLAPIYCRITVNGRRSELSTGFFIKPEFWKNEALIDTSEENVLINAALVKQKNEIHRLYCDLLLKDKPVSADMLMQLFTGKAKQYHTFIELINEYVSYKFERITEYNTIKTYNSRKALIIDYLKEKKRTNMLPEDFNLKECESFFSYLLRTKKVSRNYANREIVFLKAVFNYGTRFEILNKNPIAQMELTHDKPKPIIALTKDELLKLSTYKFVSERLQHVADMYVFQAFTGFAYADLVDFDYTKHVKAIAGKKWIFKHRVKSDVEAIVPVFPDAKRILLKYNFKLPVISLQKYNSYLTEIVDIVGIQKKLTTHTARKTFAMIRLNDGFSIESVAKMLGHNGIGVTQSTYATIGVNRIENELDNMVMKLKKGSTGSVANRSKHS